MLQFVPDGFHEIAVRLPRVDPDLEQSVSTGDRHRHEQAGPHSVPAQAFRDIDDSVGGVNPVDQSTKGF